MEKDLKILYAEDEESVAKSIIRMISTIAEVDYATNGADALDIYLKDPGSYDIILTDVKMPKMSGIELIEKIKNDFPSSMPRTIITTAYNDTDFLLKAIDLKVDKFLIKPINIDDLFDHLEDFLQMKKDKLELQKTQKLFDDYKQIVDVHNIVTLSDLEGNITYANENFCKLSGYSLNEIAGRNHNILRHPNTSDEYYKQLWDTVKNKQIFNSTVQNLAKNGNSFWLRGIIAPILDENNEIKEFISIREDATKEILQQKEIEELKAKEELENIQKAVYINNEKLVSSFPLPCFIFSKEKRIIAKNKDFEELFFLMEEEDILNLIFKNIDFLEETIFLQNFELEHNNQKYSLKTKEHNEDYLGILLRCQ